MAACAMSAKLAAAIHTATHNHDAGRARPCSAVIGAMPSTHAGCAPSVVKRALLVAGTYIAARAPLSFARRCAQAIMPAHV